MKMSHLAFVAITSAAISSYLEAQAAAKYPPLTGYMMPRDAEVALARSAAPARISSAATIRVLTASGFEVAVPGTNGFTCMVMRGWSAPTFTPVEERALVYDASLRAPICFDPVASQTIVPLHELRTKLGMEGKHPEDIAREVSLAYGRGTLPRQEVVAFGYMWSAGQRLGPAGSWRPHMMVYAPYYRNSMLGGNEHGGTAPFVGDDEGTPFTVVIVPVAPDLTVGPKAAAHH